MQADAPSFEKIDYSLRPAKSTERWMLLEALSRLSVFAPLATYQYVGFGSPFFVDFRLFHRRLAITKMVSIEKEVDYQARFDLNKPFDCIEMLWGDSAEMLSEVDWRLPTIVWLDYDYELKTSILGDLDQVGDKAKHGDCLLATVDADPPTDAAGVQRIEEGLGELGERLGSPESLAPWGLANHFYELMDSTVARTLRERGTGLTWVQLWRFHYRDSARMLTYGGVFVDDDKLKVVDEAGFHDMPFTVKKGEDPFVILIPKLTLVETGRIDKFMPDRTASAVVDLGGYKINRDQVERYAAIYRHAPAFHESQA
jgi:hypothetical protein